MKISCYSLIKILTYITYISFFGSSYASTDSSPIWYRYTIQEQSNGTSGETYSHIVMKFKDAEESSGSEESYPVSGKAVPWSNTVPSNLSDNYTEYCAMSTSIREYFQNLGIIPQDIRFRQFVDVGHNYGNPTNDHIETDFFVVLGSTKYNSTMVNSGFYMADSRYEQYSQSLLDCNSTSPDIQEQLQLFKERTMKSTNPVPEFPFVVPIMFVGFVSVIASYKIFRK